VRVWCPRPPPASERGWNSYDDAYAVAHEELLAIGTTSH
jgi:hypothetical protein